MSEIPEHKALADELRAILDAAPYPSLDALKGRVSSARAQYSHGFNPGYEQEILHRACQSVEKVLTKRGCTDEAKRSWALGDISRVMNLKGFRNQGNA
ncbi:hypothetical protein [Aliiroseovarius crassostreae]|uniref:hypothetical protein n=1 Tax=Aliiroseovarius crassostreae TaxID=154981 RepID=UPI00220A20A2|nr:hypothetical protein [Aliiroseovarius crassostreae]UWP88378.1 hypothetical protein K3J57_10755 [Aliiroseovarius crassostreae]